jgi:hypothetical protein
MAKGKKSGSPPPKSKSQDSVRSKITGIEGGLGELTNVLQAQNNNYISLIQNSQTANDIMIEYLRPMEDNIRIMAQALVGLDITDSKGNKVEGLSGLKVQGAGLEASSEAAKEQAKDNKRAEEQLTVEEEQKKLLEEIHKKMQKGGVLDLILGGAMALAGFISGFVGEYIRVFKKVLSPLTKLFGENKFLVGLIEKFKVGWTKFGGYIDDMIKGVLENKYIAKVIGVFKGAWNAFAGYFKGIADLFKGVVELWTTLFGGGGAGGFFKNIMTWFQAIGERLGWFFKLGQGLGKILGKIAIPIQVILSIWDTVTGALDGWEKTEGGFIDKLFGAIKGGLTGLLNGLIGGLLNLLKDLVSWIAEQLGFDGISAWLDSFSFTDIIGKVVGFLVDYVKGVFNFMKDVFTDPKKALDTIGNISDMAIEGLKKILRSFLPTPGASGFAGVAAKLIPDAVYEFAGMDPKTGAVTAKTSETGVATKALENVSGENKAVNAEKEAKAVAAGAAAGMANSSSQTINNNTTQAAIIKSKATNWEPDDQWARGGYAFGA